MKKIFYLLMVILLVTACEDKPENDWVGNNSNEYNEIEIAFGDSGLDISTRSFMDEVTVTEEWESRLTSLRLYVFNQEGKYVKDYSISSSDIQSGRTIIKIPREATDQYCTFHAIANGAAGVNSTQYYAGEASFAENLGSTSYLSSLNGELEKMLSGELYQSVWFPISGSTKVYINPYGYLTEVFIPLKRIVAKVALEWRIDPDFSKNHDGGIVVVDAPYCELRNNGYVFDTDNIRDYNSYNTRYTQASGVWDGWNHNLWYMYEGKKGQFGTDKAICFTGIYDKDGDLSTTDDQHPVSYSVLIDYLTGENVVKRNIVYRIQATIKGLGADNLEATWEVHDWDVPPVHTDDTGI